jgi:hypothetical protein
MFAKVQEKLNQRNVITVKEKDIEQDSMDLTENENNKEK